MIKYFFPRLRDALFMSLFAAVILFGPRIFNLDGDLGRHITIGNVIVDTLSIPTQDIFSHTMSGEPLTPHEWIAQLFFAIAHRALSLSGAVFFSGFLIAGAFTIVYHDSKERSKTSVLAFIITVLAAASSSIHWLARPHIFTFLYLAIWTCFLERHRLGKDVPLWKFVLIMLFWANTHGAFIAGFVTWAAYFAGELLSSRLKKIAKLKAWGKIGVVSFFVTFLNPVGYRLWETSFGFVKNSYLVGRTQEYLPPDFHNFGTWPFLLLIAISLFLVSRLQKPLPFAHSFLLSGWTIMALYSARNIPLYVIIAAPILSSVAAENFITSRWCDFEIAISKIERDLHGALWLTLISLVVFFILSTPIMQTYNRYSSESFPVDAVSWLEKNPQEGNVFNHFTWGGYLLYTQWPQKTVFIDGQTDFYGEPLTREYEQVITLSNGWEQVMEKYQVDWAIIPTSSSLARTLKNESWRTLYEDETAIVLRKE